MSEIKPIKQIPNTMYDKMDFPPHEHREFPMAIPFVDGKIMPTPYNARNKAHPVVVVNNQEELDELQGPQVRTVALDPAGAASRLENEDDIRALLYTQADQKGVKIDKRWSVEKIEGEISKASAPAPAPAGQEAV